MSASKAVMAIAISAVSVVMASLTVLPSNIADPGAFGGVGQSEVPVDMQDFVMESDVIASGTVVDSAFLGYSYSGFDATDKLIIDYTDPQNIPLATAPITPSPNGSQNATVYDPQLDWGLPYSSYRVLVDHVYKGPIGVDDEFSVIMSGDLEFGAADIALLPSNIGQRYLFAVAQYEGDNYGLRFGKSSRLLIDPPSVRNTDFVTSIVGFSVETGVTEFLSELEAAIENP
jgi:hypothetical protein